MALHDPPSCLIVEDQAIIAMLLEDHVQGCGYRVLGPVASRVGALASLDAETPDIAIVDYLLSDGPCIDVMWELKRRNVPFAVLSGYDLRARENQMDWDGVEWLRKPITTEPLRAALLSLCPRVACPTQTASSFTVPS